MSPRHEPNPSISLVILTKDRPQLLQNCLASVYIQSTRPKEVIIVDGSKILLKETQKIIAAHARHLPIRVLRETKNSIPFARDYGARTAVGDIVVYLDDDLAATPSYLGKFREHFRKNPALTAVMGRITNALPDNIYASVQWAYYQRGLTAHFPSLKNPQPVASGRMLDCEVMGIQRSVAIAYGFLTNRSRGYRNDDVELGIRLIQAGKRILFDPTIVAESTPRHSRLPLGSVAFWSGYSDALVEDIHHIDIRSSPYKTPLHLWIWHEIKTKKRFCAPMKLFYGLLLVLYPLSAHLGRLGYYLFTRI